MKIQNRYYSSCKPLIRAMAFMMTLLYQIHGETLSGIPGAFVSVDLGSRSSALAGAQTAAPAASEVLLHNPSALYDAVWSGGYTFSNTYSLLNYNYLAGSFKMEKRPIAIGIGFIQNGDDVYSENEIMLGAATAWRYLRAGVTWKIRYASTGDGGEDFFSPETGENTKVSGQGVGLSGFDLGVRGLFFKERFIVGWVIKDMFSGVAWETENDAGTAKGDYWEYIPMSMAVGVQIALVEDLQTAIDIDPGVYNLPEFFDWNFLEEYSDIKNRLRIGVEWMPIYRFSKSELLKRLLVLRMGYAETLFEKDKSKYFAVGTGLAFPISESGKTKVSLDGGYQISTVFRKHSSFRLGISIRRD